MVYQISAIICTHNRVELLEKAISSLVNQTMPKELYEIIVVDNASTDATKELVKEKFSSFPNITYIYEPVLGLSQARNTGYENASGIYIAYLDDDAIAAENWLTNIVAAFQKIQPRPACVGGKVEPIWEVEKPAWLHPNLTHLLTILDYPNPAFILSKDLTVVGANIAFTREILQKTGGFDLTMGRKGKTLLSWEDSKIQNQIEEFGYSRFYDASITVKHLVPKARLTKKWFYSRLFWEGVSRARQDEIGITFKSRIKFVLYNLRGIILPVKNWKFLFGAGDNPEAFKVKGNFVSRVGYILAMFHLIRT